MTRKDFCRHLSLSKVVYTHRFSTEFWVWTIPENVYVEWPVGPLKIPTLYKLWLTGPSWDYRLGYFFESNNSQSERYSLPFLSDRQLQYLVLAWWLIWLRCVNTTSKVIQYLFSSLSDLLYYNNFSLLHIFYSPPSNNQQFTKLTLISLYTPWKQRQQSFWLKLSTFRNINRACKV